MIVIFVVKNQLCEGENKMREGEFVFREDEIYFCEGKFLGFLIHKRLLPNPSPIHRFFFFPFLVFSRFLVDVLEILPPYGRLDDKK